jgi:hypothetical protein
MENNNDDDEYEISIYKEVLSEKIAETAARYYRCSQKTNNENLKSVNVFLLNDRVQDAKTMQELTEISDILLEHNLTLNKFA